jgi:PAT family acetyl-CoA transporter-like MFS transporter 1
VRAQVALCLPALVSKYTAGPRPLDPFLGAIPYRLATNLVLSAILVLIPARGGEHDTVLSGNEGGMSVGIWALLLVCLLAQQVLQTVMFVAQMSFFAKVSDPAIGGTYMTLLNTVANLGSKWPTTCALWLVHVLTVPGMLDGYHVLNVGCTLVGALWFVYMRKNVAYLDSLPAGSWCLATAHGVHAGGACLFFRVERQSTYAVEEGTHKVDAIV